MAFSIAEATWPAAITRGWRNDPPPPPVVAVVDNGRELRAIAGVVVCMDRTGKYGFTNPACIETSSVVTALKVGDLHSAKDSLLVPLLMAVLLLMFLATPVAPPPSCAVEEEEEEEEPPVST
jgi:hypothetical protein